MKIKLINARSFYRRRILIMMMKTYLFLFCTTIFGFTIEKSFSQEKITIKVEEIVSVDDVFNIIQDQTKYRFLYPQNLFANAPKVQLKKGVIQISDLLSESLSNIDIEYELSPNNRILIRQQKPLRVSTIIQKQHKVSGTVTDDMGEPLPGASIIEKGTKNGVTSDFNGHFTLNVSDENAILVVSYLGFVTKEIYVNGEKNVLVSLKGDVASLDEVVLVGYGTQKKEKLTGAISSVNSKKLTVSPVASTSNALAGRLPGLISKQSSGQPGADAASLSIRGFGNALVIVDGIESSFNNIDANQIASLSILKDGAASIYGARAGNGVILVTTKRGQIQKPTITLTSSKTYQGVTKMLKPVNAGQKVELSREGHFNSGGTEQNAPYTLEAMNKYYDGTNPLFPNTDWYSVLMRDWAPQQQHNLSVRGGSDKIKYYGFLGFLDQESMIKKNGGNYERFNLQSNIDAQITDELAMQLDIASTFEDRDYPARGMGVGGYMWQDYWTTDPMYHSEFPDKTKIPFADGAGTGGLHITSNSDISGYNKTQDKNFRGTLALTYKIKAVEGLSLKAFGNYNQNFVNNKVFTKPVKLWSWDPESDIYTQVGSYGGNASLSQSSANNRTVTTQLSANYKNTINDTHEISAMVLLETIDFKAENLFASRDRFLTSSIDYLFAGSPVGMGNYGGGSEMGRQSVVSRLNYAYKDKYMLEAITRADASAKFSKNQRWGYFPSFSLGWLVSEENFMEGFKALDKLKLRFSYGESGNDAVASFQYLTGYSFNQVYLIGNGVQKGLMSSGLANEFLTWEEIAVRNAAIDYSFFDEKIYGSLDVFYRTRSGIPGTRLASLPSTFGADLPQENLNELSDRGFEFSVGNRGEIAELKYDLNANISWSRAKWEKIDEPEYTDPDQERINKKNGNWIDLEYGYKTNGLFTSQEQIDNLNYDADTQGNSTLKPGDIIYLDTNEDGVVDWKDKVEIGQGARPHWMTGFDLNLQYKNFELSALFQGAFAYNTNVTLGAGTTTSFYNRWTEENNNSNAIVPRIGSTAANPSGLNDFNYKSASYLRLKSVSLGYSLPEKLLNSINISDAQCYVAATNLLTFSRLNKYDVDPEAPNTGWYYPQQRTISLGVKFSL
ncbi:TonB-linked outer membrane protein, SusC/RagA family [Arenibacter nanhaiticus]|uniref:TonB-linked outer membrane protein, SusC/RagA family n=1 Tax=Arenibacter nanhaiticus TaxID=558155 RepID=A0A1M6MK00_9FLAO|nr:TonB-dependent receptor [Arenibacter nanhaiticus]SHJ83811.1 TonB-linked outer membrane protein, SusC/RagA family [Arenibacter nanhaiticus]